EAVPGDVLDDPLGVAAPDGQQGDAGNNGRHHHVDVEDQVADDVGHKGQDGADLVLAQLDRFPAGVGNGPLLIVRDINGGHLVPAQEKVHAEEENAADHQHGQGAGPQVQGVPLLTGIYGDVQPL